MAELFIICEMQDYEAAVTTLAYNMLQLLIAQEVENIYFSHLFEEAIAEAREMLNGIETII